MDSSILLFIDHLLLKNLKSFKEEAKLLKMLFAKQKKLFYVRKILFRLKASFSCTFLGSKGE